jgi:hypothetical protein
MVALAPNRSETSPWDVLDPFPKLHSRARELKTTQCTEVPHSKSRSGIEIWLTIYDCRDGLESFTRDPIGFEGSEWGLYQLFNSRPFGSLDPTGEICQEPCKPRTKKQCCSDAKTDPIGNHPLLRGRAFCCDGSMVACVWDDRILFVTHAKDLIAKCIGKHEDEHVADAFPCPAGCPRFDNIRYMNGITNDWSECRAYLRAQRCIFAARRQCVRDPSCNPREIDEYGFKDLDPKIRFHCGKAGMIW